MSLSVRNYAMICPIWI